MRTSRRNRTLLLAMTMLMIIAASARLQADTGTCEGVSITLPFTDVAAGNIFFCSIAEAFFSGLSNGTSATTYSPSATVTREQMAAFVTRTMDQSLKRGSRRAALKQFWTHTAATAFITRYIGDGPLLVESDGADLWVANSGSGTVSRVRASDGYPLGTWTGAPGATGVLAAIGLIFVTGNTNPGAVYVIDPIGGSGPVGFPLSPWGANPLAISFDGERIWSANNGSVSILTFDLRIPIFSLNTVTAGFDNTQLNGILYDGSNIWVSGTNHNRGKLFKLDSNGGIIQTVNAGNVLKLPVFDGTNIWVPSQGSDAGSDSVMVVRASTGEILATLTGNGLNGPVTAAFDGERILVTNYAGNSVSLWRATDLSPLGFFPTGAGTVPYGACSDGLNFWITLSNAGELVRF